MKKIYFTLGILLVATFAMAYLYFSKQDTAQNANEISLRAIAQNSSFIFCFDNDKSFYEILSGQELLQNVLGKTKSDQLTALKESLIADRTITNAFAGQKVYIGFVPGVDNQIDYVIGTQIRSDAKALLSHLQGKVKPVNASKDLYQFTGNDSTTFFIGIDHELALISNTPANITKVLQNQQPKNLDFSNYIQQHQRFTKNTLANVYIDFNRLPQILRPVLNSTLTGELAIFNHQHTFAALTYNFSREKLLLNGPTTINDQTGYEALFSDMEARKQTIVQLLPEKTASYTSYTINDYPAWQGKLNDWLTAKKEKDRLTEHLAKINQSYGLDLQGIFPKYFKDQLLTFQLNTGEKFGAISLKSGEKVGQLLLDLSADYATDVRIMKEPYLPYAFFGEPFKKFERPFFTIIDNYLVMANNASSIQSFLNSYSQNKLLTNTADYIQFSDQLPAAATICFYINQKNAIDIFGRNLKMPYYRQYISKNGFNNYTAFAYQLTADHGKFQSNVLLYKKTGEVKIDTLQTTKY